METQCELIASSIFRARPASAGHASGAWTPPGLLSEMAGSLKRARCPYPAGAGSLGYKEERKQGPVILQ